MRYLTNLKRLLGLPLIVAVCAVALSVWYVFTVPDPLNRQPAPIRALLRNRPLIDSYINRIQTGQVRFNRSGYPLIPCLAEADAVHCREEGECIAILFAAPSNEPVPTLVFSPRGRRGLPKKYDPDENKDDPRRLLDFTPIDANWFYCRCAT